MTQPDLVCLSKPPALPRSSRLVRQGIAGVKPSIPLSLADCAPTDHMLSVAQALRTVPVCGRGAEAGLP